MLSPQQIVVVLVLFLASGSLIVPALVALAMELAMGKPRLWRRRQWRPSEAEIDEAQARYLTYVEQGLHELAHDCGHPDPAIAATAHERYAILKQEFEMLCEAELPVGIRYGRCFGAFLDRLGARLRERA